MIYFSIFPLLEGLPGERPAVEVEQVEGEEADLHHDLLLHGVLPLPGGDRPEGLASAGWPCSAS